MEVLRLGDIALPVERLLCVGAEAHVYKVEFLGRDAVVKVRLKKTYRTAELDEALRKRRTQSEAMLLNRAKKAGVKTPSVLHLDLDRCALITTYVDAPLLREVVERREVDLRRLAEVMAPVWPSCISSTSSTGT